MSFNDWLDHVIEAGTSCTMDRADPIEALDELEHEVIRCTGCNLNGITINHGE